ncbi:MAG: hypothetical protein LUO89_12220 [Methanothrix sp.]|nr:hypothetical protein [Methanothrix sp.]
MIDSKRGRCVARSGKINAETAKGINHSRKPNRPIFKYLFIQIALPSQIPLQFHIDIKGLVRILINFSGYDLGLKGIGAGQIPQLEGTRANMTEKVFT